MGDPVLDSVRCPGCLLACDVQTGEEDGEMWRTASCAHCGYELDPDGVVTLRQMIDGAETGANWNDVDLPAWTRLIAHSLAGVAAGPQATQGQDEQTIERCTSRSPQGDPCVLVAGHGIRHAGPKRIVGRATHRRRWGPGVETAGDLDAALVVAVPTDPTTVRVAEVRRPIPGARDMTGEAVSTGEDPTTAP